MFFVILCLLFIIWTTTTNIRFVLYRISLCPFGFYNVENKIVVNIICDEKPIWPFHTHMKKEDIEKCVQKFKIQMQYYLFLQ